MERARKVIYALMVLIPLAAVLFVLGTIHWLLLLAGLAAALAGVLVLQKLGIIAPLRRGMAEEEPDEPPLPPTEHNVKHVYMVLSEGDSLEAQRIRVDREHFTIGREPDNDWVLGSARVSRHHLSIDYSPEENACYVSDCGSRNGTFLNGRRLEKGERCKLVQGDYLMIDDRSFNVQYAHF